MPGLFIPHSVGTAPGCSGNGAQRDYCDDVRFTVVDLGYGLAEGDDLGIALAEGEDFAEAFFSVGPSFTNFASNVPSGFFQ